MRNLVFAGALLGLALAVQGCGGHSSPTEPGGTTNRGNWIGTVSGKHASLHLDGTCVLEMNLDPALNGHWWVDCPGASSQGEVLTASAGGIFVMGLFTTDPRSDCPWNAIVNSTASTIDGDFQVTDCTSQQVVSTGTLQLRRR